MKGKILKTVDDHQKEILRTYSELHDIPEVGFEEVKTSHYLKEKLKQADINVKECTKTGILAEIEGSEDGSFVGLRGDMDALPFQNEEGKTYYVHACGHDSHATMVLWTTLILKELDLVQKGNFRAIFQPGEEKLVGAKRMIEAGAIENLDELYGVHIRPIQEARFGQASPALWHGASTMMKVTIHGKSAHGARPHLGSNAIDGAALAILGINSIWGNPAEQWSVKATKITGGGTANNIIPEKASFTLDMRAAKNDTMEELIDKVKVACNCGANTVGGECKINLLGSVPAAEYDKEAIGHLSNAIRDVLGEEGLLASIESPGSEDFHEYKKANPDLKVAYLALGSDCTPGLHDPEMTFNTQAIINGVKILTLAMYDRLSK